jgi:hypothetical protein
MHDKEAIDMMERCVQELQLQRNTINVLEPRAEAYEVIHDIVRMSSRRGSMVAGEDLIWRLKKKIEELQPKPEATDAQT